jgi:hypothetical protein
MDNEQNGVQDNLNPEEVMDNESEETVESLKAKIQELQSAKEKADEIARNQKIRAEKAELEKKSPKGDSLKKSNELSQTDVIAIIKNNVDEEDIPDVADFAKLKGISIAEALKTPIIKTILKEKQEERSVAEATHTGVSRKGASKVSDETLIANARAGKMPETEADMKRLIEARKRFK